VSPNARDLEPSLGLSAGLGVHAVEVHALDDRAAAILPQMRVRALADRLRRLYFPIATAEDVLGQPSHPP
jgi:hypothetical protein